MQILIYRIVNKNVSKLREKAQHTVVADEVIQFAAVSHSCPLMMKVHFVGYAGLIRKGCWAVRSKYRLFYRCVFTFIDTCIINNLSLICNISGKLIVICVK